MILKIPIIIGLFLIPIIAIKFFSYPFIFIFIEITLILLYIFFKQKIFWKRITIFSVTIIIINLSTLETFYSLQNNRNKSKNKLTLTNGFRFKDELGYLTFQKDIQSHATLTICDTIIYDAIYTSNDDGLRISPNLNSDTPINVIFLGGSFTFGDGVMDTETLPYQFEILGEGKYSSFNYGRSGSGARGMLRDVIESELFESSLNGSIPNIAIFTSLGVHVLRDINYNPLWYRLFNKSYLSKKILKPAGWDINVVNYVDYISTIERTLKEKYNTRLIVLLWEGKVKAKEKDWFSNSDKLVNAFKQKNIDIILVEKEIFSNYDDPNTFYHIKGFDHPTAIANTRIANYLHNYLTN